MERKMKEQLEKIYEAPRPDGKRAFLRRMEQPPLRIGTILWTQCFYLSKWEWILSVILLGGVVAVGSLYREWVFSVILALVPFLAVVSVSESVRSITWGMSELEMSARFSLKSVVLARMVIVGVGNVVLELLLALLVGGSFWENVLYMLMPYLLTAYGSLILVRMISGKEGIYACAGLGMLVGMVVEFSTLRYRWIYQGRYTGFWFVAVCFIMYLTIRESKRNIRKMEEIVWN